METNQQNSETNISGMSLFSTNKAYRKIFINSAASSLITFLISFFVVYVIYQLVTIIMAKYLGFEVVWRYDKISFPLESTSPLWRRRYIILIFAIGPIVSFVLGYFFYLIFVNRNREKSFLSMFSYWASFHSFTLLFCAFIAGSITNDGLGYVISWLYIGSVFRTLYSLLAAIAMITIGIKLSSKFTTIHDHDILAGINSRNTITIFTIFIPWALGYFILSLTKIPGITLYEMLIYIFSVFLIAPSFSSFTNNSALSLIPLKSIKFPLIPLVIIIVIILLYRIILNTGISF